MAVDSQVGSHTWKGWQVGAMGRAREATGGAPDLGGLTPLQTFQAPHRLGTCFLHCSPRETLSHPDPTQLLSCALQFNDCGSDVVLLFPRDHSEVGNEGTPHSGPSCDVFTHMGQWGHRQVPPRLRGVLSTARTGYRTRLRMPSH